MVKTPSDKARREHDQLMTADEVASMLRVSRSMVYLLIRKGELRTVRIHHALRFRAADVQALIDGRNARAGKPKGRKKKG